MKYEPIDLMKKSAKEINHVISLNAQLMTQTIGFTSFELNILQFCPVKLPVLTQKMPLRLRYLETTVCRWISVNNIIKIDKTTKDMHPCISLHFHICFTHSTLIVIFPNLNPPRMIEIVHSFTPFEHQMWFGAPYITMHADIHMNANDHIHSMPPITIPDTPYLCRYERNKDF